MITLCPLVLLSFLKSGEKELELEKCLVTLGAPWEYISYGDVICPVCYQRKIVDNHWAGLGLFGFCEKVGQMSRSCNCISGTIKFGDDSITNTLYWASLALFPTYSYIQGHTVGKSQSNY